MSLRLRPPGAELARLEEECHFLRQLLDALPAPVFYKDGDGRYLGGNRAFEACSGIPRDRLVGKSAHDIAPPRLADLYAAADRDLFRQPGPQVFEADIKYADGSPRSVLFCRAPFSRPDGHLGGLVGMILDITERKAAERERLALEARLRQAQKMESIGHLCGGIAHDFNNILAAILGYTELCRLFGQSGQGDKVGQFLDEIQQAATRARDLIAQLLAFSRSGEATADAVTVAPIVKEVHKLLRSTFPATVAIAVTLDEGLADIRISPVQLHQVLMNLGINARDAVDGRGRIEVRAAMARVAATCASCHREFAGEFVCFAVRDDGQGIRPEDLPQIFDPFFTTKEVGRGSGLGLSVLHGIVHAAGGHVEVLSEPGRGSEFRVHLPAAPGGRRVAAGAAAPPAVPRLRGRILVVDDEPAIVGFVATLLEAAGGTVTGLTDPHRALERFRSAPQDFDLVITDHTMPGLTGTELARQLLALRPELPVILCTAQREGGQTASAGIRRVLHKPVGAASLAQAAGELLAGAPLTRGA